MLSAWLERPVFRFNAVMSHCSLNVDLKAIFQLQKKIKRHSCSSFIEYAENLEYTKSFCQCSESEYWKDHTSYTTKIFIASAHRLCYSFQGLVLLYSKRARYHSINKAIVFYNSSPIRRFFRLQRKDCVLSKWSSFEKPFPTDFHTLFLSWVVTLQSYDRAGGGGGVKISQTR